MHAKTSGKFGTFVHRSILVVHRLVNIDDDHS